MYNNSKFMIIIIIIIYIIGIYYYNNMFKIESNVFLLLAIIIRNEREKQKFYKKMTKWQEYTQHRTGCHSHLRPLRLWSIRVITIRVDIRQDLKSIEVYWIQTSWWKQICRIEWTRHTGHRCPDVFRKILSKQWIVNIWPLR
jgi:hypothetical protein